MLGLSLSLSLGSFRSRGGTPAPPVSAPTILTAPTISLSGTTATIALGTFDGATSETHELLADGVPVATATAGDLDVSAYAGQTLKVISTGTNAGGATYNPSEPVSIPASGFTFRNANLDTAHGGPYAVGTDASTITGITQIAGGTSLFFVRSSGAIGMAYYGAPGILAHNSSGATEIEVDAYAANNTSRVTLFGKDGSNYCYVYGGNTSVINLLLQVTVAGAEQNGGVIASVDCSAGNWLKFVKTGASTVDVYHRPPSGSYSKIGSFDASTASNYGDGSALGSYFGMAGAGTIDPLADFTIFDGTAAAVTVGTITEADPSGGNRNLTVPVSYTGTPTSLELAVYDQYGAVVKTRYTAVASPSGGSASIALTIPQTVDGTVTVAVYVGATAVFGAGEVALVPAPPATQLWMNESFVQQWSTGDQFRDKGLRMEWRNDANSDYIIARGRPKTQSYQIASDDVGSSTTVKMDYDGRIYADNGCAGITNVRCIFPFYITPGIYDVTLVPGLALGTTLQVGQIGTGYTGTPTYNSTTGVLSIHLLAGDPYNYVTLVIPVSSIPPGGLPVPKFALQGDANPSRVWTDLAISNITSVASGLRLMTARGAPNEEVANSSDFQDFVWRTGATRWTGPASMGPISSELALAAATEGQIGLWWNALATEDDSAITADMTVLSGLDPALPLNIEFSNENWNSGQSQQGTVMLLGLRRGYGNVAISTKAAAVAETIINADSLVDHNASTTLQAFASGDKIFFNDYGHGQVVYQLLANVASGSAIPQGLAEGVTSGDWKCLYDYNSSVRAWKRYHITRLREIKAIADPIMAAAGRPATTYNIGGWAQGGFSFIQPMLDWDGSAAALAGNAICIADYWGGGNAGYSAGPYADTSVPGWGEAEKDQLYGTGGLAAQVATFFASGGPADTMVDASIAQSKQFRADIKAYCLSKGLAADAYGLDQYELNWHAEYNNWPDQAPLYADYHDNTTLIPYAYKAKAFAVGSDGKTYRAKIDVPAGTVANDTTYAPTGASGSTYWAVFVDSNGTTWDATNTAKFRGASPSATPYSQQSFNGIMRSAGFGTATTRLLAGMQSLVGGKLVMFDRVEGLSATGSADILGWGFMENEADNDTATNYRLAALADFKAAL